MADTTSSKSAIPVGISACLMGEQVRYNGGHKRSRYCLEVLQECFAFEPFCPELEAGLGVPREPIRLVGAPVSRQGWWAPTTRLATSPSDCARPARRSSPATGTCVASS
ncbi:DUF523 domain-containing protein [Billgrantia tianxiuensis]|uniref:DUF523 domain-containing protein n=1 Tax=Billgrantia tianxiuensis TaxID=2497861 RepID=UPI0030EB7B4A